MNRSAESALKFEGFTVKMKVTDLLLLNLCTKHTCINANLHINFQLVDKLLTRLDACVSIMQFDLISENRLAYA